MNYTLNQLQIFTKIVDTGSITKAAEELHLTQPAVSIQLKNFQDQFDIALTETIGRKIFITDFGMEIYEAAEKIIGQVNAINYKTLAYRGQLTGKLKISVVSTGKYVMPYFLSAFLNQHEGIQLQMDVTNKASVVESLEKNEVDFALVSLIPQNLKVQKIDLIQNKLYLVGKKAIPAEKKSHSAKVLSSLPLLFREPGSGTRQTMEGFIRRNNIPVLKKLELTSNEAVKQAVLANLGYSIMPLIGIRNEILNHELQIIPVKGLPITTTWSLIWLENKKLSPISQALLQHLQEEKSHIIENHFHWHEHSW
jgi:DNA-binding transcriptional LysR family regulator